MCGTPHEDHRKSVSVVNLSIQKRRRGGNEWKAFLGVFYHVIFRLFSCPCRSDDDDPHRPRISRDEDDASFATNQ